MVEVAIDTGSLLCGSPEEICEQLQAIELFGTQVIPEFDREPSHSTTRFREGAARQTPQAAAVS
jgi:hypothetical protein